MVITRYPLSQNNGNLTLPFFGGNYPFFLNWSYLFIIVYVYLLVHLDNIFSWSYMLYKNLGWWEFSKFSQRNSKFPLSWLKQVNYPLIPICAPRHLIWDFYSLLLLLLDSKLLVSWCEKCVFRCRDHTDPVPVHGRLGEVWRVGILLPLLFWTMGSFLMPKLKDITRAPWRKRLCRGREIFTPHLS